MKDLGLETFLSEHMKMPVTRTRILATTRVGLRPFLHSMFSQSDYAPGERMELIAARFSDVELGGLEDEDAAAILERLNVKGTRDDLIEAAKTYCKNDPLTLTLFARYLQKFEGDLARRTEFSHELSAAAITKLDEQGRPHAAILSAFSNDLTPPEQALMKIVGLFDRPVEKKALEKTFFSGPGFPSSPGPGPRGRGRRRKRKP